MEKDGADGQKIYNVHQVCGIRDDDHTARKNILLGRIAYMVLPKHALGYTWFYLLTYIFPHHHWLYSDFFALWQ